MVITHIDPKFMLNIPDEFRKNLSAGQEVAISMDEHGRLVVTPVEQVREALMESFGIWAERKDIPADGTKYVDAARKGKRLDKIRAYK